MIMSAVLAVALGAAPAKQQASAQVIESGHKMSELVRDYRQTVDRRGVTHLSGHDKRGRPFDIAVDRQGRVEGSVGVWDVSFHAADAG